MHNSYFTGRIYVEKTSKQCYLGYHTHRELGKVADRTNTQVGVQMINKWRVKMIQKKIYKVEDSPWKGDRKREEKEQYSNLNHSDIGEYPSYTDLTSSNWKFIEISILGLCLIVTWLDTSRCSTHQDSVLWPTLYKFIVLGSLDQDSILAPRTTGLGEINYFRHLAKYLNKT